MTPNIGKERCVWFIDDEPYYVRPYRDSLQRAGFRVKSIDTMADAITALNDIEREPPAAMVVDVQMPQPPEMLASDMVQYQDSPGLWFVHKRAKHILLARRVPIVILTQRDTEVLETRQTVGNPPLRASNRMAQRLR